MNVDGQYFQTSYGQFVHTTYATRNKVDGYYIQTKYVQLIHIIGIQIIETVHVMTTESSFGLSSSFRPFSDVMRYETKH